MMPWGSFAANPESETHSICVPHSGRLLCIRGCVWPSAAGDERFGQDVEQVRPHSPGKKGCPMWFAQPPLSVNF